MNERDCTKPTSTIEPIQLQLHLVEGVRIDKVVNGFIIKIGCCTFVAKTKEEIFKGLAEYWDDPSKAREKYCK